MAKIKEELQILEAKGLKRKLVFLESEQSDTIIIDGSRCLNLCSNNYLGLANDARLKEAAVKAIKEYGVGTGASRLVCGNTKLYQELEEKLAQFKQTEAALVFNSGYTANIGIISSLADEKDIVLSDRLNHASIIDGILLSGAKFRRYAHKDMVVLEGILKKTRGFQRRLIITDTVFSMDGDIAPVEEIANLAEAYDAEIMVDEAHATGVFGNRGSGVVEHFGLGAKIRFQMGTLSKAVGSFGAYICADKDAIDYLVNKARSLIYTTSLPPAILAASIKAIEIIEKEPERRQRLFENAEFFRKGLQDSGFNTLDSKTPIIPVLVGDPKITVEFSRKLFQQGIYCTGIRPPTVPEGTSRLRFTVIATHKRADLEIALEKIAKIAKELKII